MGANDIYILKADEIRAVLNGREREILEEVERAYLAHSVGDTSLPHSTFLRFPNQPTDRIIALPAYVGGDQAAGGLKWISSFPANTANGMDRASAVLIVNSLANGRAEAIMEGSIISAKRTAASAALAARALHSTPAPEIMGLVGCGLINYEIVRFCKFVFPGLKRLLLFDTAAGRAESVLPAYKALVQNVTVTHSRDTLFRASEIISFATTAATPHVSDLAACPSGCTVLHVSLRDLAPEIILEADNVVDDPDHVCRASTSVHLAEQKAGNRTFIRCSLGDVLNGSQPPRRSSSGLVVFSPFGLGILDIAVAKLALRVAQEQHQGTRITDFHPESWMAVNREVVSEEARQEMSA